MQRDWSNLTWAVLSRREIYSIHYSTYLVIQIRENSNAWWIEINTKLDTVLENVLATWSLCAILDGRKSEGGVGTALAQNILLCDDDDSQTTCCRTFLCHYVQCACNYKQLHVWYVLTHSHENMRKAAYFGSFLIERIKNFYKFWAHFDPFLNCMHYHNSQS